MISIDGFFCGPKGEIGWHNVDEEFNAYAIEVLDTVDTFLFGGITYDLMASYWPTEEVLKDDPEIAKRMNEKHKIVFSKTKDKLDWNNSTLMHEINPEEVLKMKQEAGKDMIIYGSGTIVAQLTELGLIDEYRFMIAPVIIGKGKTVFSTLTSYKQMKLIETRTFSNGNVMVSYIAA